MMTDNSPSSLQHPRRTDHNVGGFVHKYDLVELYRRVPGVCPCNNGLIHYKSRRWSKDAMT